MPLRSVVLLALAGVALVDPAAARASGAAVELTMPSDISAQRRPRARTRILIVPLSRYYRECVDWYALEHRPSGDVVTPQMRCRWVAR